MVHGYERAVTGDYHDDNWLTAVVEIKAGAFNGKFGATFLTAELIDFRDQLTQVYDTLKGEAVFSTLEEQLSICVTGNGRGDLEARGAALDQPGIGNKLEFHFSSDQTHLVKTLGELNETIAKFPVRSA